MNRTTSAYFKRNFRCFEIPQAYVISWFWETVYRVLWCIRNWVGGCRKQDGQLKVKSYALRTLTPAKKNYHLHTPAKKNSHLDPAKLEFLALKWAITDRFRDYLLYGSPFDVYTDNNPLTYVLTTAKLNATGLRWVADLANFSFKIHYRSGTKNKSAYYLSRHLIHEVEQLQKDSNTVINSEKISLYNSITNAHYNSHTDIVLQLNSVDNMASVRTEQLIESQLIESDERIS